MESDADYRQRIPAAFEGMSVAGPVGAYEYHALSSDGRVADASAFSPSPAEVVVTILAREGDGTAPDDLLQVVGDALNDEAVRPVADRVSVRSAEIVRYEIDAVLYVYPGPAKEPILAAAKAQGTAYINEQRRLGRDVRLSAIYAALHVQGVQRVELMKPLADMVLDKTRRPIAPTLKQRLVALMNSLLPPGSSALERRLAQACSGISDLNVPRVTCGIRGNARQSFCPIWHGRFLWTAGRKHGRKPQSGRRSVMRSGYINARGPWRRLSG